MKKTALIALMVTALMLGTIGYAFAEAKDVTVTAKVPATFSMTLDGPASFDIGVFGAVDTKSTSITVKSNKLWDFSKTPTVPAELSGYLTDDTSVAPATGIARGVHPITASYELDLTGDAAFDLEAGDYVATYQYTAVQQ